MAPQLLVATWVYQTSTASGVLWLAGVPGLGEGFGASLPPGLQGQLSQMPGRLWKTHTVLGRASGAELLQGRAKCT